MAIPYLLRHRPIDSRGFVTPWIVDNDHGGPVDFRILNPQRVVDAVNRRLCAMCGGPMGRYVYFIGGPLSHQNKVFNDPAMHESCARYSLVACPHLSRPGSRYSSRDAGDTLSDVSVLKDRPNRFGLMKATNQTIEVHKVAGTQVMHVTPDRWVSVVWFDASCPMAEQVNQQPMARE
jgi:hypothetical protein